MGFRGSRVQIPPSRFAVPRSIVGNSAGDAFNFRSSPCPSTNSLTNSFCPESSENDHVVCDVQHSTMKHSASRKLPRPVLSLDVVACGQSDETLRNSLPSTIAAYPDSHHHLLHPTIPSGPTSAIKSDSVDQYCRVVSRVDDVEHVEFMASRVALGHLTSELVCRGVIHATVRHENQGWTRPNRTHKGGRIRVFESVPCRPLSGDKGRVGFSTLLPVRYRRVAAGSLLAERSRSNEGESHSGESRVAHGWLRWWILAFHRCEF